MVASAREVPITVKMRIGLDPQTLTHIEAGRALLENGDEISAKLARFSSRQKRCLAAHAIAIMLIDGDWKGTEQGVLENLTGQMHLYRFDAEKLMKVIHALYHVAVFA